MYMIDHKVSVEEISQPPDKVMQNINYSIKSEEETKTHASGAYRKDPTKDKKVADKKDLLMERIFKLYEKADGFTLDYMCEILN